jgi:hypothetical protein
LAPSCHGSADSDVEEEFMKEKWKFTSRDPLIQIDTLFHEDATSEKGSLEGGFFAASQAPYHSGEAITLLRLILDLPQELHVITVPPDDPKQHVIRAAQSLSVGNCLLEDEPLLLLNVPLTRKVDSWLENRRNKKKLEESWCTIADDSRDELRDYFPRLREIPEVLGLRLQHKHRRIL